VKQMCEHDEHRHQHGHGDEAYWREHAEHHHQRHGGECGCGGHGEHHRYHHHGGDCGCGCEGKAWGPGSSFRRRFPTREERIAWLEEYLKGLQAEAKGVEERIAEMKASE
jgi:hypothetical protein